MKVISHRFTHKIIQFLITASIMLICLSIIPVPAMAKESDNDRYFNILDSMADDYTYALEHYENGKPAFTGYDRNPETPNSPIKVARYHLSKDGIYRSSMEKDGVATILFTGDLMCQKDQQDIALSSYGCYDFRDNFTYVKDILSSSDFTVGNLETMLSESASFYSEEPKVEDRPQCNAPSTFLDAVRYAGFDMVVAANNHNCDTGIKGIFQTLAHLEQYRLISTGLFKNKTEKRYKIIEIDGIKVAFMAYAKYYNTKDQYLTEEGKSVLLNKYSKSRVAKDVKAAKAAGAEYIISYIHWGKEFTNTQSAAQEKYAQDMADAGVDYIIGSHPHALMPYDHVTASDGRIVPVIYSLGNFVSHITSKVITSESMILKIELTKNSSGKVLLKSEGYIPCRILKTYKGNHYTCFPLTSPYNDGKNTVYAKEAYPHIRSIISTRLKVLGKFSIKNTDIKQAYTKTIYSGNEKKPSITLTDGLGNDLKRGTDFTVTRSNNVLPGISTIKIKGIGLYTDTVTKKLYIRPEKITNFKKSKKEGKYIFTWDASTGADGYYVYIKNPEESSYTPYETVADTKVSINPPAAFGTYRVRVAAYKESSEETLISPFSTSLKITVE